MDYKEQIKTLLQHPDDLLQKKPFTRGAASLAIDGEGDIANVGEKITPNLPNLDRKIVSQAQFMLELDPNSHKILFDDNIPSITVKTKDGNYYDIEYKRMAVPFQMMIKNKHVLHLCGNPTQFTILDTNPTETQKRDFTTFKKYWKKRNQDGMRTKMVDTQMSYGDAGLLYYFDRKGQIKSRLLSYADGYVLCPVNDDNGDRIMECVYYSANDVDYLDCYTDENVYRFKKDLTDTDVKLEENDSGWVLEKTSKHGFSEIPLVTKRGDVAWNDVQETIEVYEVIYNIFLVIQKRHGWGILYIKGKFSDKAEKIAGAIVLNDTSIDGNGSAEFKTPPTPQGMLDTLNLMEETIQKGSGTTFLLPKDIKMSGDISGVAIQLTQSLDNETALNNSIEWQNVADKMARLFKEGLAKELVQNGKQPTAVTDFDDLELVATFKPWRPRNDYEYNNMLISLSSAGLISTKTGIQKNTESAPDEEIRMEKEKEEKRKYEEEVAKRSGKVVDIEENVVNEPKNQNE